MGATRRGGQRARRGATVLLAGMLATLSGYALLASWQQTQMVQQVSVAGSNVAAYQQAAYRSALEMALIQAALGESGGAERQQLLAADEQAYTAMLHIVAVDRGRAQQARAIAGRQQNLRPTIELFLGQLDRGDTAAARATLETVIEPSYARISSRLAEEQSRHLSDYTDQQASARRDSQRMLWGSLITFGLSLIVLALFGWSARVHRRQVELMAATDALTGLPNRVAFSAHAQQALADAKRSGTPTVLIINIDGFRDVNDQLGPAIGDRLLIQAGGRLASSVRDSDLVARLGGDEFAVLLRDSDAEEAEKVAHRLREIFHQPYLLDDITVDLEISIGAVTAEPGDEVSTLLRHADIAMHAAKQQHDGYRRFTARHSQDCTARLTLLGDLRRGLDDSDQLTLHYQPKIAVGTGTLVGVEALARWHHPTKGLIPPNQFIPVLENTSLIHRFTDHVLTLALCQARRWLDAGHRVPVAVNISTRSLLDPTFPDRIAAHLGTAGVPGELLCIEVTEHSVMNDPTTAIEALRNIRSLGVKTSIDDYGTGYSSMSYLKMLPIDELKIDRSFVCDMATDTSSHALVASTIRLGHDLGLTVVAEGVEDTTTVAALAALDCNTAQGYHYARPQPADDLTQRFQLDVPPRRKAPVAVR
ncbi:putative bifunctional diguanylate cyclase/phosphodiesterase [Jidongwangia harbinensis]|uniref:putative bifunctional diguanylate cyclase/phosphodiesterase n=1 Tax=Jidongwangia harbinensis TaxID=2878561 RepID=UPI001CD94BDC|nr:bifunctional diguanylate cyclase/phosphodiesterase [Jidongwangia harbinensis]MCA2215040.1 bifunctional diguanylate cyclase/phosphodiesterase [Jidongwangia harbinensis]